MKNYIIIGAGPIGLYTALRLHHEGIPSARIHVIDRRHGQYTRPGYIERRAFEAVATGLKIPPIVPSSSSHIKDLERALYAKAQVVGIQFSDKNFTSIDERQVRLENGESIEADFVFDCTGSMRSVIHSLNETQGQHFEMIPITEVAVKGHFIAYGKMLSSDVTALTSNPFPLKGPNPIHFGQPTDAQAILTGLAKLKALGWKHNAFPTLQLTKLEKGKVALYMERPDHLSPDQYETWVNTLIQVMSQKEDIRFTQLPPSRRYAKKPRYTAFRVAPEKIEPLYFHKEGHAEIIPLGDSQISPDYRLGHGIISGIRRVDDFLRSCEFLYQDIAYYDGEDFSATVTKSLNKHEEEVQEFHQERRQDLLKSSLIINAAIQINKAQLDCLPNKADIINIMSDVMTAEFELKLSTIEKHAERTILQKQIEQQIMLLDSYPDLCHQEKIVANLERLSHELKDLGGRFYRLKQFELAKESYEIALAIFEKAAMYIHSPGQEITLSSNNLIVLNQINKTLKDQSENITYADKLIAKFEAYPDFPEKMEKLQKIHSNRFTAMANQAKALLDSANPEEKRQGLQQKTALLSAVSEAISEKKVPGSSKANIERLFQAIEAQPSASAQASDSANSRSYRQRFFEAISEAKEEREPQRETKPKAPDLLEAFTSLLKGL